MGGVSVKVVRERLGEALAEEFHPEDIDIVTFLPRCPESAARKYAEKINKPFVNVFYKPRDERAFLGSTSEERAESIRSNLFIIPEIMEQLKGKTVAMIDDSTIRGNNSRRATKLLNEEGQVKKAYLVNYTPPIGIIGEDGVARGCMFGVDMPPDDNFIARGRTTEQISEEMGINVVYLSSEGMLKAFEKLGIERKRLCTYCIGGSHPLK